MLKMGPSGGSDAEAPRARFTPRALLDLRDLLRHFQEKAAQASTLAEGTREQSPPQRRVAATGDADESRGTVHDG